MANLNINEHLSSVLTEIEKKVTQAEIDRNTLEAILPTKKVDTIPGLKMNELINLVGEINLGKKTASGSISRGTFEQAIINQNGVNGGKLYVHRIPVKNLGFVPSKILIYRKEVNTSNNAINALSAYYDKSMDESSCYAFPIDVYDPFSGHERFSIKANNIITPTGFNMIAGTSRTSSVSKREYYWFASE